jgi:ABC-type glycerol-3-phosphate transport system substrate-binding protein
MLSKRLLLIVLLSVLLVLAACSKTGTESTKKNEEVVSKEPVEITFFLNSMNEKALLPTQFLILL